MGCFLACFGFHKRRKRRRPPGDRVTIGDQIRLSYEPLDSSQITTCDTIENPEISDFKYRDRPKEQPWVKIRKKVSFNLNIQTYEPVPDDHNFLESDEEVRTEKQNQKATNGSDSTSLSEKESTTIKSGQYPQNYRYQNCRDSYDEEEDEDYAYDESDLDDNETDEDQDESKDEYESCELEMNKIDRTQHVYSVLKPVENLTQWRTAKEKAVTITKKQMGNIIKTSEEPKSPLPSGKNPSLTQSPARSRLKSCLSDPGMKENLVHTSLSDWLVFL